MMGKNPEDFIVTQIPQNFIYPEIKDEDYKFGSGELTGTPLRPDADWRNYLPPEEDQNVRGIESSACYVEASQHTIATLEDEQFGEVGNNYASRFNALLSAGTVTGGDPLRGGDSIRHDGLIPDAEMPFGDSITSWNDFHSWKGVSESLARAMGKEYLNKKIVGYDIVCQRGEPVTTKYLKLRQALQYSPCPVSVTAWYENDGVYYKPDGLRDNHLVELVYIDADNHPYIRDTYAPYMKKLEANFNFDFGMRWSVEKQTPQKKTIWSDLLNSLLYLFTGDMGTPTRPPVINPPIPVVPLRQKIYEQALNWLGKDPTPDDKVSDEVACASSLSFIVNQVTPFPNFASTTELFTYLKNSPHWKATLNPDAGNIIVSPTGGGNGTIATGHCGILTGNGWVMSNTSATGHWDQNYSIDNWVKYFRLKGGYHIYYFTPVE